MLSAEDIAATKVAIELCNASILKREILGIVKTSEKLHWKPGDDGDWDHMVKKKWDDNVEKITLVLLEKLGLGKCLQKKVTGYILQIGVRMRIWAKFHECYFGISRDFSVNFLNRSHFTWRGLIDNIKAAEELMECYELSDKQKYKLACQYCFVDEISDLYCQLSKKNRTFFYTSQHPFTIDLPELTKFWAYYRNGIADELAEGKSVGEYLLEISIKSGNKTAVEYSLERIEISSNGTMIINAILEALKERKGIDLFISSELPPKYNVTDWVIFLHSSDFHSRYSWNPRYYFLDMLCFLFDKMSEYQQVELLKKNTEDECYDIGFTSANYNGILGYFLTWPYQDYFKKAINLMWDFLPDWIFADLLSNIGFKIRSLKGTLFYGEEETYNYRKLFKEFWCAAPQHYKRYIFSNQQIVPDSIFMPDLGNKLYQSCFRVLRQFFLLKNFTNEDRRIVELILESATAEEKRNIIFSDGGDRMCVSLFKENKWERLDLFMSYFLSSKEEADKFKREFLLKNSAMKVFIPLAEDQKWEAIESFIKWTSFSEDEMIQLKREMILSDYVKRSFRDLILKNISLNVANMFCEWFASSENELTEFKKDVIFSEIGDEICSYFVRNNKFDLLEEFVCLYLSSPEDIIKFRINFVSKEGGKLCKYLISSSSRDYSSSSSDSDEDTDNYTINFNGGKWEQVEKFLAWSFSSKTEIKVFKRNVLFDDFGKSILFDFIKIGQHEAAETFFSWLELSLNEIKDLKKDAVFPHMSEICKSISGLNVHRFLYCDGSTWENLERFLRWFLTDKKSVLQFKERFDQELKLKRLRADDLSSDDESSVEDDFLLNRFYQLMRKLLKCLR